VPPTYSINLS